VTRYDPCFRVDPSRIRLGGVHCLESRARRTGNQGPRLLDSRNDGKPTGVVFACRSATMPRHAGGKESRFSGLDDTSPVKPCSMDDLLLQGANWREKSRAWSGTSNVSAIDTLFRESEVLSILKHMPQNNGIYRISRTKVLSKSHPQPLRNADRLQSG
jgi:hypothetical protein